MAMTASMKLGASVAMFYIRQAKDWVTEPFRDSLTKGERAALRFTIVGSAMLMFFVGTVAADGDGTEEAEEIQELMRSLTNILQIVIAGVAIPNGVYGVFQYMTAGANVEQDERGRKRIRRTFIGLAGVAAIQLLVEAIEAAIIAT